MMVKCPSCKGKGILEFEAGLIQIRCEVCKGKGEAENDNGDEPSIERTGLSDSTAGGKVARKHRKSRKYKARQFA